MTERPDRIVFVFLDGVGIGENDAGVNPLVAARLPVIRSLLGGRLPVRGEVDSLPAGTPAVLAPADATLGVQGKPQSGTGQTALLTGDNAPAILGRHFGPWVPTALRDLLAERNVLRRAAHAGCEVAFANAYPEGFLDGVGKRRPRPAAPPLAARAAGALTRHAAELREGRAVASSITNEAWRMHLDAEVPEITAERAGRNLARLSTEAALTLFAHYDTDLVGHRGDLEAAVRTMERVDAFLGGLLAEIGDRALLLVASDHGNIEEVGAGHTLNPVPVIGAGPGRERVAGIRSITDVAPAILGLLGVER